MDEKAVPGPCFVISEEKNDALYPMFFGVSFALFALRILSHPEICDEKLSEMRSTMLQGSAQLLGLLVWRVKREEVDNGNSELLLKLENSQREIEELKKQRSEDAKANEKVVGIYAAQEQCWFNERKKLRQQIGVLMNELRVLETNKNKAISDLSEKLREHEVMLQAREKIIEEDKQKRQDIEENLERAEKIAEELRSSAKLEAQRHSVEATRHKTAFIELVSNQRQLEAEMGRAVRQVEAAKQELDLVLEQKEQSILMTQKLSMELVKMRKDLEQKDQILSALLRKSKLDTAEKQMLLKEVKLSKAKRKQAEQEMERWKAVSESRNDKHSLKSMFSKYANPKLDNFSGGKGVTSNAVASNTGKARSQQTGSLLEYDQPDCRKDSEFFSSVSNQYMSEVNEEQVFTADIKHLEGWVRSEAEKYSTAVEQRHHLEIDAFAEQLRNKDEKLESLRWRQLSMELESKRLQSHIEGLNHDLTQLRQEKEKLEALLLNQQAQLKSVKEQLESALKLQSSNKTNSPRDLEISRDTLWSKVKIVKRKVGEKEQERKAGAAEEVFEVENEREYGKPANCKPKDIVLTIQYPQKEIEGKDAILEANSIKEEISNAEHFRSTETSTAMGQATSGKTNSTWKMDLHALGVSYKIKRLKQQFVMLERLTGKGSSENNESNNDRHIGIKGFCSVMSLLNKQVDRYQSLQGKIDDLCKRMHDNDLDVNSQASSVARTKEETKILEHFLEETFQLQRYIVATGQKLMEVQGKIASGFVGAVEEFDKPSSFDTKRFADNVRTLFRDVQRGLEVRIARIIGDLEGTLACDGIIQLKK